MQVRPLLVLGLALMLATAGYAVETDPADAHAHEKVVVPFDFVSKFDDGRYGRMVADMIWKKLEREGGVLIPESMADIRDLCAAGKVEITPQTPLDDVHRVIRETFDADVAIWGSVERAPGHEWEAYDLSIKCVDFSHQPPKVIYSVAGVRTNSVSEIPHLYVKQMLDKLYGRQPGDPALADALAEKNWLNNPNLVVGGDFQRGAGGVPMGWESTGGQEREPLGNLVRWVTDTAGPPGERVLRFTFDAGVGDGFGVMYYCKPFPVEEGAKYRFQCRWRSNGPKVIIFIKCYDRMESEYKAAPGGAGYVPDMGQLRECYRAQLNMKGPKNAWNVHTQDFTPKHTKYTPSLGRVMFYSYLGAGVVEFDDVVIKQIVPASPSKSKKVLRHSLDSNITIEEMQENERRGR